MNLIISGIFSLAIRCGPKYPDEPPEVRFRDRVNMNCVDKNGFIKSAWGPIKGWTRDMTLETVLVRRLTGSDMRTDLIRIIKGSTRDMTLETVLVREIL